MTTATNIQIANHGSTGKKDNDKEAVIMQIQSNIQGIIQNNAKVLAGIVVGGMIAAASIFPGNASADSPARPSAEVEGASPISSTGLHFPEVDDWVSLTYSEKLVTNFDFPEVDDWVALTYSEKLVASKFASPFDAPDADDLATVTHSEKLVSNFDYPESLILNDNFSMVF